MKRVLIIAYYWPPSGGSGVQRWLNFTKYLPEFGWKPVVYTPENPDFDIQDQSLLKQVNSDVEVIKYPIWEPYSIHRKLFGKKEGSTSGIVQKDSQKGKGYWSNWIRGNVFIPDPKLFWRKPSVKFLKEYLKHSPVEAMISTGTPHSMHLIALDLKREFPQIPWIADFRDPWSELDMLENYHILPWRFKQYEKLEAKVLQNADLCMTASKIWAKDFERLGAKKCIAITNGFDEKDFSDKVKPYDKFVISHFGLLNHLRDPIPLWKSIEELLEESESFRNDVKIHLGGTIDPQIISFIKQSRTLNSIVKVFPYLTHKQVVEEYLKSSVLLLLLFNSSSGKGNIPGKLFEYIATRKPIFAFGPEKGDSAEIIEIEKAGVYFHYEVDDFKAVKQALKTYYNNWKTGKEEMKESDITHYSRKSLTKKLANNLNQIVN